MKLYSKIRQIYLLKEPFPSSSGFLLNVPNFETTPSSHLHLTSSIRDLRRKLFLRRNPALCLTVTTPYLNKHRNVAAGFEKGKYLTSVAAIDILHYYCCCLCMWLSQLGAWRLSYDCHHLAEPMSHPTIQGPRAWLCPSHNGARVDLEQPKWKNSRYPAESLAFDMNLTIWNKGTTKNPMVKISFSFLGSWCLNLPQSPTVWMCFWCFLDHFHLLKRLRRHCGSNVNIWPQHQVWLMGMLLILIENGRSSKHLEFPPPEVKRGKDHP